MGTHPIFESDFDCLTDKMATRASLKYGTQLIGHNFVPAYQVARFKPHRHRVLDLYKKAYRSLSSYNMDNHHFQLYKTDYAFCFERTVLRARFDENKHVTSLAKATELLKDGEEEFWLNQHWMPDQHGLLVESQHGIAFQRYSNAMHTQQEGMHRGWGADEWARYPDIFDNYKKWYALRNDTWEEEMATLEEADSETIKRGERLNEDWPAAKKADGPPPFWWRYVARPLERPRREEYDDLTNRFKP